MHYEPSKAFEEIHKSYHYSLNFSKNLLGIQDFLDEKSFQQSHYVIKYKYHQSFEATFA